MAYTGSLNHPVTVLAWLSVWSEVPQPPNRVFLHQSPEWFLPFWCRPTHVVLGKSPLDGCLFATAVTTTNAVIIRW